MAGHAGGNVPFTFIENLLAVGDDRSGEADIFRVSKRIEPKQNCDTQERINSRPTEECTHYKIPPP
jgi:hypothetical protein